MTPSQCSLNGWRKLSSEIGRSAMTAHSSAKKVRPRPSHMSVAKASSEATTTTPSARSGRRRAAGTVWVSMTAVSGWGWSAGL